MKSRLMLVSSFIAILLVFVLVFQNQDPMTIWFFVWEVTVPKAAGIASTFAIGVIAGMGTLWLIQVLRQRKKAPE